MSLKSRKLNRVIKFLMPICILCIAQNSYANTTDNSNDDGWKFDVAPYVWAMNMSGTIQVAGQRAPLSQNFSDILSQLQGAGMLWLAAQKDQWGFFLNSLYAVLSQNTNVHGIPVSSHNDFGLFTAGISYEVFKTTFSNQNTIGIDPYIGARYTLNDTRIKVGGISASNNQNWTDPIVGARVNYDFTKQWSAIVAADVGGTNFNTDKSYNINGLVGYKPTSLKNTTFYLGYRLLYQNYLTGSGLNRTGWDMKIFGPMLGVSIRF